MLIQYEGQYYSCTGTAVTDETVPQQVQDYIGSIWGICISCISIGISIAIISFHIMMER
jgi:hypothetical protein